MWFGLCRFPYMLTVSYGWLNRKCWPFSVWMIKRREGNCIRRSGGIIPVSMYARKVVSAFKRAEVNPVPFPNVLFQQASQ